MKGVTLSDHLIAFLFSCRSASIYRKNLWQNIQKRKKVSRSLYHQNIYRLRKRGLVQVNADKFVLTKKGVDFHKFRKISTKPNGSIKIICIFDIPEPKKKVREWLRTQLKLWGFEMIQKSVWIGKGPFPKEFRQRLKLLNVDECVKTFKVNQKTQ